MRGNHIQWGRQDYTEPAPISARERALVESCFLVKCATSKFWHDVYYAGKLVGGVAIYMSGQVYRPIGIEAGEHLLAARDWNSSDPQFANAILNLLNHELNANLLLAA